MLQVRTDHGGEEPRADDLGPLGAQVHGERTGEAVGVVLPAAGDLRGERRGGPRVHDVGIADEAARNAPLIGGEAGRDVARRVDGKRRLVGHDRVVPVDGAVRSDPVPEWERHPEEALPADEPVTVETTDPVVVAGLHEARVPVQLGAPREQLLAEIGVAPAVAQVPLAARDDLEGAVPLLEELHRMGDGPGFAGELARLPEQLHDADLGLLGGLARQLGVGGASGPARDRVGGLGPQAAVALEDVAHRQVELAPPDHVGEVAERADHGDAGPLVGLGELVGVHRHVDAEQGRRDGVADEVGVALVVGVAHQGDARREELRPGRLDEDGVAAAGGPEPIAVIGAWLLPVLELGLGHGGLERDVPQRGRLGGVGLPPGQVAEERPLARTLGDGADRRVGERPVDAQADAAPQILEHLFVLGGEANAQLDEARARARDRALRVGLDGGLEGRIVGEGRVATNAVEVLHPALGGQAVVVPSHRVEDLGTGHAPEAGQAVGLHVAEHRSHVQRAAHRGGRGVDAEHFASLLGAVEPVGAVGLPPLLPARLEPVEGGLLGDLGHPVNLPGGLTWPERPSGPQAAAR